MDAEEYKESSTVRLDWTIRGLKQLFESSKGETKSRATKSVKFGGGRWQILFYPNSGTDGGQFVSLYLSCEPTMEEKDNAIDGKWVRAGLYKFCFELRNLSKTIIFSQKEAVDHSFSWKTANWGWAQFARRDAIYYQPNTIRSNDAFLISCTISSSPAPPSIPPRIPHRSVPRELLDVVGSLLDDPAYSDVEFILPRRRPGEPKVRRIFAARSLLNRAEYFRTMFGSGFAESSLRDMYLFSYEDASPACDSDIESSAQVSSGNFEDSDDEDEATPTQCDGADESEVERNSDSRNATESGVKSGGRMEPPAFDETPASKSDTMTLHGRAGIAVNDKTEQIFSTSAPRRENAEEKITQLDLSSPSSPWKKGNGNSMDTGFEGSALDDSTSQEIGKRYRVVVKDVAYSTYRAVLYYLYTDSIIFAPLSSAFLAPQSSSTSAAPVFPPKNQEEGENMNATFGNRPTPHREYSDAGTTSRIAWIRQWERQNPGKPTPCSAKAVYRIADKLGLSELKERAFQHIFKSLTIHNVPYEMFSSFSSTFEDIRKIEVAFFLEHWNEIRTSRSMQTVWQQIRAGRHPGFEEVWPLIAMNLEFRPREPDNANGDTPSISREIS